MSKKKKHEGPVNLHAVAKRTQLEAFVVESDERDPLVIVALRKDGAVDIASNRGGCMMTPYLLSTALEGILSHLFEQEHGIEHAHE